MILHPGDTCAKEGNVSRLRVAVDGLEGGHRMLRRSEAFETFKSKHDEGKHCFESLASTIQEAGVMHQVFGFLNEQRRHRNNPLPGLRLLRLVE